VETVDPPRQVDRDEIGRHRVRPTGKVRPVLLDAAEWQDGDRPIVDVLLHIRARQIV
jgi:hypothetical protein